nr:hypothetical protein BaRGS_033106 [Batillaria attramentaria]
MIQDKDAQRVSQEAELRAEINDLKSKVVFTTSDIHGLGVGQILKFDRVLYNVGNGYDPTTGYFTAPSAGTYAFYNRVMVHAAPGDLIQTAMYKGNILLAYADACCHAEDSGTTMVTMHLSKGETVHIQVHSGNRFWGDHTIFTGFKLAPV